MDQVKLNSFVAYMTHRVIGDGPRYKFGRIVAKNMQGRPNNRHNCYTIIWDDGHTDIVPEVLIDNRYYLVFDNEKALLQFKLKV
jgi:hypothetical protein